MCGRINIQSRPIRAWVLANLGIDLPIDDNDDLRPTQSIGVIHSSSAEPLVGHMGRWGIQPSWAKRIIINAQAETVAEKKTFKTAIRRHRCIVPCTGWYEWRDEGGPRKQKYHFGHTSDSPLFMAGIYFSADVPEGQQSPAPINPTTINPTPINIVTLTTKAQGVAADIHHRMPVFISPDYLNAWLTSDKENEWLAMMHTDDSEVGNLTIQQV